MAYYFLCKDKPGAAPVRAENREAHLAFLASHADRIVIAGPLQDEAGTAMLGSLLVLNFDTLAEAEAFAAADPYAKAGLFQSVEIGRWKQVLPKV